MGTRASSILATALGQIRYRFALAIIGFGVFMGALLACLIPLAVCASYFDKGGAASETFRWTLTGSTFLVALGLTYRCRKWIIRQALEEASPEPIDVAKAGLAMVHSGFGLVGLLIAVIGTALALVVAALLVCVGYLLLTMLSLPVAILIGAAIIALAVLVAASR
jgi:hypothetical protein